jgi:hypothetical protein
MRNLHARILLFPLSFFLLYRPDLMKIFPAKRMNSLDQQNPRQWEKPLIIG